MNHDIELRINNWYLVYKDHPQYRTAQSLEGSYIEQLTKEQKEELAKQQQIEVFEKPTKSKAALDHKDAKTIEDAVAQLYIKESKCALVLVCDTMYRYLLINNAFYTTCKAIGISKKHEVFDDMLKKSKLMLENILQKNHTSSIS